MSKYWYDADKGTYNGTVRSDRDYYKHYKVSFEPNEGVYSCECPAYRYGAPKHCKHIDQQCDYLRQHAAENQSSKEEATVPDAQSAYTVSMNGNEPRTLERTLLDWLLDALLAGDEITVRRA